MDEENADNRDVLMMLDSVSPRNLKGVNYIRHRWVIADFAEKLADTEASARKLLILRRFVEVRYQLPNGRKKKKKLSIWLDYESSYLAVDIFASGPGTFFKNFRMGYRFKIEDKNGDMFDLMPGGKMSFKSTEKYLLGILLFSEFRDMHKRFHPGQLRSKEGPDSLLKEDGSLVLVTEMEFHCKRPSQIGSATIIQTATNCKGKIDDEGKILWEGREETGDVTLKCENKAFKVHKSVLMSKSDVFEAMFRHEGSQEAVSGVVKIEDTNARCLEDFLRFLYLGTADLCKMKSVERIHELLCLADKYNVKRLKNTCETKLGYLLKLRNIGEMALFAETFSADVLMKYVSSFVALNLTVLVKSHKKQFDLLPGDIARKALEDVGKGLNTNMFNVCCKNCLLPQSEKEHDNSVYK